MLSLSAAAIVPFLRIIIDVNLPGQISRSGLQNRVKVRGVIKILEADGSRAVLVRGSHRQFKHASKTGKVTVAGHPSAEIAPGTLNNILKQAGLKDKM